MFFWFIYLLWCRAKTSKTSFCCYFGFTTNNFWHFGNNLWQLVFFWVIGNTVFNIREKIKVVPNSYSNSLSKLFKFYLLFVISGKGRSSNADWGLLIRKVSRESLGAFIILGSLNPAVRYSLMTFWTTFFFTNEELADQE